MSLDEETSEGRRQMTELRISAVYGDQIAALAVRRLDDMSASMMGAWHEFWMQNSGPADGGLALLLD